MTVHEVTIEVDGSRGVAIFKCERTAIIMTVTMPSGVVRVYKNSDYYNCLGELRREFSKVRFLCKGSKINVHPSRMSSQMAGGIIAYEIRLGEPASEADVVNIFDYEDQDLASSIEEQVKYHEKWMNSLSADSQ